MTILNMMFTIDVINSVTLADLHIKREKILGFDVTFLFNNDRLGVRFHRKTHLFSKG